MLIDTHCHIHDTEFYHDTREVAYQQSFDADVTMICVGTDVRSSREAVEFARTHDRVYAIVGVHPHEARHGWEGIEQLITDNPDVVVGIGEIGLDYFYEHSSPEVQQDALRAQLALAQQYSLPVSLHVREAFDDFWPIFDEFQGIRGVMHSFTDTAANLQAGFDRGLLVGVNGISTFTKDEAQQQLYASIPLEKLVLETDAPFLTPKPFRGKMNIPAYVGRVAEHHAHSRGVPVDELAAITTANAKMVFNIT